MTDEWYKDPAIVTDSIDSVTGFLAYYGWYLFAIACGLVYIFSKLQPFIKNYFKRKSEDEYAAKYHKDPELLESRFLAMEESRRRMQEKHNQITEEYKKRSKELEEKKREEWLKRQIGSSSSGYRLGNKPSEDNKKSLKQDYNPLMGDSGGRYRAPKKSSCGGGGCGKK